MPPIPQQELAQALRWGPWPIGDPPLDPRIWDLISQLDRGIQVQVVQVVLETHIAQARASIKGMTKVQELIGGAAKTIR